MPGAPALTPSPGIHGGPGGPGGSACARPAPKPSAATHSAGQSGLCSEFLQFHVVISWIGPARRQGAPRPPCVMPSCTRIAWSGRHGGMRRVVWPVLGSAAVLAACGGSPDTTATLTTTSTTTSAASSTTTVAAAAAPASRTVKWVDLQAGDCLADPPPSDPSVVMVTVVDCAGPHLAETFLRAPVPVNDALSDVGNRECGAGTRHVHRRRPVHDQLSDRLRAGPHVEQPVPQHGDLSAAGRRRADSDRFGSPLRCRWPSLRCA